jgi:hypothetical protein
MVILRFELRASCLLAVLGFLKGAILYTLEMEMRDLSLAWHELTH